MKNKKQVFILVLGIFLYAALPVMAEEKNSQVTNESVGFYEILNQSTQIVKKQDSLTTQTEVADLFRKIETYLNLFSKASNKNLSLPVTLSGLLIQMSDSLDLRTVSKALIITKGGKIDSIDSSVLLLDGSATIGYANNSVIVATGGVEIAHGSNNVILTGQFVHISHEGSPVQFQQSKPLESIPTSVVVSGYRINISHATNTVVSAPGLIDISNASGVVLINSPKPSISHRQNVTELKVPSLVYPVSEAISPVTDEWGFSFTFEDFVLFRKQDGTWGRLELPKKK
ncbi:MAG: hypothetical protein ABH865_06990 [Candidatus Omnitrophota bacterium]